MLSVKQPKRPQGTSTAPHRQLSAMKTNTLCQQVEKPRNFLFQQQVRHVNTYAQGIKLHELLESGVTLS